MVSKQVCYLYVIEQNNIGAVPRGWDGQGIRVGCVGGQGVYDKHISTLVEFVFPSYIKEVVFLVFKENFHNFVQPNMGKFSSILNTPLVPYLHDSF